MSQVSVRASQACEAQSASTWHFLPVAQVEQTPPPQSTSVSGPSCRWSEHWSATQVLVAALQAFDRQSESTRHCWPGKQAGQLPPPQSTPVSAPSLMPSVHDGVGGTQAPAAQVPLGHTTPQAPQLLGSEPTSMHPEPQSTAPAGHVAEQAFLTQALEQHSAPLRQGSPVVRHEASGKSTPTVAWPFCFISSVTLTGVVPTVAYTGLREGHVTTDADVTALHAPA